MLNARDLVPVLWRSFIDEAGAGGPVFFSFSADLLRDIFPKGSIECPPDPVQAVCAAASGLFVIVGDDAVLCENALTPDELGFSPAIVLVCQQVLAVEAMVRQPGGFSENAYFPRLRRMMSDRLSEASTNPFSFYEFEAIWRTLAREIRSIRGNTDASITFRFGVESGINKARSFPFSQALLSLEDLRVIVSGSGQQRLQNATPAEAWRLLKQLRSRVSRRAQRLIGLGIFRDRVVEQVLNYAKRAELAIVDRAPQRTADSTTDLSIFRDTSDWLADEFRAFLTLADGQRVYDDARIATDLNGRLRPGVALVMPTGELGDCWVCSGQSAYISPNDSFLVVGERESINPALDVLRSAGVNSVPAPTQPGPIGAEGRYQAVERISTPSSAEVTVRDGKIVGSRSSDGHCSYAWIGGVAVDKRRSKFLRGALPSSIRFGAMEVQLTEMVSANQRHLTAAVFLDSLRAATEDVTVDIGFPGGRTGRLSIAVCRYPQGRVAGYLVDSDGMLSASADRISTDDFAVFGFREKGRSEDRGLDARTCAQLLAGLRSGKGEPISKDCADTLRVRVLSSRVPNSVKTAIVALLDRQSLLPLRVLQLIEMDKLAGSCSTFEAT